MVGPKEVAVQAAKATLKVTAAPFTLSLRMWVVLLKLVVLTLTTPQRFFKRVTTAVNNLLGSKLRTEIECVSQYSRVLRRETHELQERLQVYESELKKAERLREDTFEEMREIRADVARVFEAVRDKKASHGVRGDRKASYRQSRQGDFAVGDPSKTGLRARSRQPSRLPRWLTHVSVLLALGLMWNFSTSRSQKSVERKLLLSLLFPMLWLYTKSLFRQETDRDDTKNRFVVSSIAWFLVGFMCCAFFHPHD